MGAAIPWNAEMVVGLAAVLAMALGPARSSWQRHAVLAGLAMAAVLAPRDQALTIGMSVVAVASLRGGRGAVAPAVALTTLGLLLLAEATSLTHLLAALTLAGTGLTLVRRLDGHGDQGLAALGFALAACGGILWCGLGGSVDFAAAREGLSDRASLPPLAVYLPLPLLLGGLVLGLLAPVRAASPVTAAWLVTVPIPALLASTVRVVLPLPPVPTLQVVPMVLLVLGGVLALGSLLAALARTDAAGRYLISAPALLGLAWIALSLTGDPAMVTAATAMVRLAVPALFVAVLLLHGSGPWAVQSLGLTLPAWILTAVPPLPAWQPRVELLQGLLANEAWWACGLAGLATLLALPTYLLPVIDRWRDRRTEAESPPPVDPLGRALAWLLLVLIIVGR